MTKITRLSILHICLLGFIAFTLSGCTEAQITVKVTNDTPGDMYQITVSASPSCTMCNDASQNISLLTRGQFTTVTLKPQTTYGDTLTVSASGRGATTKPATKEIILPTDKTKALQADVSLSIGI